jgi:hypothetical protein
MAYTAQLASKFVQNGQTILEYNAIDDAGVLPDRRVVLKFDSEVVTQQQINQALIARRDQLIEEYTEALQKETDRKQTLYQLVSDGIDEKCQQLEDLIKSRFPNSPLIDKLKISWEIKL